MSDEPKDNQQNKPQAPSLADMVAVPDEIPVTAAISLTSGIKIAVLAGLFVALNYRQFPLLYHSWMEPNWSHGFIIPLFSLFLLWNRRDDLAKAKGDGSWWGLPIVIMALLLTVIGFYPLSVAMVFQSSMVLLIFGLTLTVGGWKVIRVTWLPIAFLMFAVPISPMLYERIAVPLQNFAAKSSTILMTICGVEIRSAASALTIVSISGKQYPMTVAEACSGVRSLMAFMALGVAMAYLTDRPIWQRVVLVLAALPVAIFCNVLRVTGTSLMHYIDRPELGKDFMHSFMGMVMLIPAGILLWLLSKLLNSLLVEVDEEEPAVASQAGEAHLTKEVQK